MKKIISLGGNYFQMTAVKAAKRMGVYVIDVDYLPDNPAHKYADEYYNISTLDREAVLHLAQEKRIDGIISYASDISASTAAYVAEKMGLPANPFETVEIMSHKDRFHPYLKENGFYVPMYSFVEKKQDIYDFAGQINGPVILKPVCASGSKGISRIDDRCQIESAYQEAQKYAGGKHLIVEEFIHRSRYQIAGDAFVRDGKIVFFGIMNEHFSTKCSPLVPVGESFPAAVSDRQRCVAREEIQKALTALHFKNGAVNLDFIFDADGKIMIIELGPRNGGNLITDVLHQACGVDLAEYTIKAALGEDFSDLREVKPSGFISSYIWHTKENGIYQNIRIKPELRKKILRSDIFVHAGEKVHRFDNGGYGLGAALLRFESEEEMLFMMDHMDDYYEVEMW